MSSAQTVLDKSHYYLRDLKAGRHRVKALKIFSFHGFCIEWGMGDTLWSTKVLQLSFKTFFFLSKHGQRFHNVIIYK